MYGYVYLTTNLVNGRKYIGQHKSSVFTDSYKGSGLLVRQAFEKYGWNNFKVELLEECDSKESLDQAEIRLIKDHDAVNSKDYYNIAFGGSSRHGPISESHKQKLSEFGKTRVGEKNPFFGKHHSEDSKRRSVQSMRKYYEDSEYLDKIGKSRRGKINITNGVENRTVPPDVEMPEGWWRGVTHSAQWYEKQKSRRAVKSPLTPEEVEERCRAAHKNRSLSSSHRNKGRIWVNDGSSNKFIKEEDLSWYLEAGYRAGRLQSNEKHKGTFFITDGTSNKLIRSDSQIPEGWWKGVTRRS